MGKTYYERVRAYADEIFRRTGLRPETAVVLGTGFGSFADRIDVDTVVNYSDLEGFPTCSAEGHVGRFVFGKIAGKPVVLMQGRIHYYEGYELSEVVLPLRVLYLLGVRTVFFTNAAGSMTERLQPGDFMLFTDQIAFLLPSPVRGKEAAGFGPVFPDTTGMFDEELRRMVLASADRHGVPLKEGVYIQASGPHYESPAEMRVFASWGADAVGMSTAVECIAACQMGMRICALSSISNMESGVSAEVKPLTHEDVLRIAESSSAGFASLMFDVIPQV